MQVAPAFMHEYIHVALAGTHARRVLADLATCDMGGLTAMHNSTMVGLCDFPEGSMSIIASSEATTNTTILPVGLEPTTYGS